MATTAVASTRGNGNGGGVHCRMRCKESIAISIRNGKERGNPCTNEWRICARGHLSTGVPATATCGNVHCTKVRPTFVKYISLYHESNCDIEALSYTLHRHIILKSHRVTAFALHNGTRAATQTVCRLLQAMEHSAVRAPFVSLRHLCHHKRHSLLNVGQLN